MHNNLFAGFQKAFKMYKNYFILHVVKNEIKKYNKTKYS